MLDLAKFVPTRAGEPHRRSGGLGLWRLKIATQLRRALFLILLSPTVLCLLYYGVVAADEFESETRFVVRSPATANATTGLSFLVQLGLVRSQDDSYIVHDFLTSRDALRELETSEPLLDMYSRPQADFLARFPSIIFGRTDEELYEYYQRMITVIHSEKTGITTLKTYAFTAGDAQRIAQALLRQGEALINRINRRIQSDAIANSERRLEAARAKVVEAQTALVTFRNTELTIDPEKSAVALMDLIGRLAAELGLVQAQMTQLNQSATGSPTLTALQVRASALETQIREERLKISGNKGLADRISKYERLSLELEFANRSMTAAEAEAAKARSEATRQLLYLERIVEPSLPDEATYPKRMRKIVTVFVVNILLASLLWLVVTGVKEHGAGSR